MTVHESFMTTSTEILILTMFTYSENQNLHEANDCL